MNNVEIFTTYETAQERLYTVRSAWGAKYAAQTSARHAVVLDYGYVAVGPPLMWVKAYRRAYGQLQLRKWRDQD